MDAEKTAPAAETARPQNPFAAFTAVPGLELWRPMMQAQTERFEHLLSEMERMERERHQRALSALDDVTELMKSTVAYQREVATQWREMSAEATRKVIAMGTPEA